MKLAAQVFSLFAIFGGNNPRFRKRRVLARMLPLPAGEGWGEGERQEHSKHAGNYHPPPLLWPLSLTLNPSPAGRGRQPPDAPDALTPPNYSAGNSKESAFKPTVTRRRRGLIGAAAITCGLALLAALATCGATTDIVRAANRNLQVGVDKRSGQIVEFIDLTSRRNLAGVATDLGGLWEVEFTDGRLLSPTNARTCDLTPLAAKPGGLRLEWRDFGLARSPALSVEVTVRLDPRLALSRWQISLHNLSGQTPRVIRFPRLLEVAEQPGDKLAVPVWLGEQSENPSAQLHDAMGSPKRQTWHYPGLLSLQCLALANAGSAGLYVACDDTADYLKDFSAFGGSSGGFNLEVVHRPENAGATQRTRAGGGLAGAERFGGHRRGKPQRPTFEPRVATRSFPGPAQSAGENLPPGRIGSQASRQVPRKNLDSTATIGAARRLFIGTGTGLNYCP